MLLLRSILILSLSVPGFSLQSNKIKLNVNLSALRRTALDLSSPLFGEDANEEEYFGESSERSMKDGKDMANLFYREMQRRSDGSSDSEVKGSPKDAVSSSTPSQSQAPSTEDLRRLIAATDTSTDKEKTNTSSKQSSDIKFTGQNSMPPPQPFSRSPREAFLSGNTNNGPKTPREVMMEREYKLVERAERNIGIQAVFAILALAFNIYIGLTGGITSRPEGPDFGADEMVPFEQMIPTQRDRENTVWL